MGGFGIAHWAVVAAIGMVLLGRGRFSAMAGDLAKGIKEFKKGMSDAEAPAPAARPVPTHPDRRHRAEGFMPQ